MKIKTSYKGCRLRNRYCNLLRVNEENFRFFSVFSLSGQNVGIAFLEKMANQHRKPSLFCSVQPMHSRTDQVLHRIENVMTLVMRVTIKKKYC